MLQTDRNNRPRIHPVNWSLTAILFAACGGGGGGSSGPVTSANIAVLPDGTRRVDMAEGKFSVEGVSLRAALEEQAGGTEGVTFRGVTVGDSGLTGTAHYTQDATGVEIQFTLRLSGPDASFFTITETGEIRFRAAPDFERPQDSGQDNEYDVTATATGTGLAGQAVSSEVKARIRVTDVTGDDDPTPAADAPLALDVL